MFPRFKEDTTHLNDIEGLLKGHINGKVIKHEVQPLTAFSENFGSEILRVEITVEENGQEKELHAVAKLIPPTEFQLEVFNTQVTFKNEMAFYSTIAPLLQDFQRENHFSKTADYFPKSYGSRFTLKPDGHEVDMDAVILLENLKIDGYINMDRIQGLDLEDSKEILRCLANFQATVVGLKLKKPDDFYSKVRPYLTEFKAPVLHRREGKDPMLTQFESIAEEDPHIAPFLPRLSSLFAEQKLYKTPKTREPWATFVHNDLWVNNIMLKHINNEIKVKFVDFQITDYGSPINDLIFFLLTSVKTSLLNHHFDELILFYYNEFVKTLKQLQIDVKDFSYESFQEELKLTAPAQVFHATWMMHGVMRPRGPPKMPASPNHAGPPEQVIQGGPDGSKGRGGPGGHGKPEGPNGHKGLVPFELPPEGKEKLKFIVETAAEKNWI